MKTIENAPESSVIIRGNAFPVKIEVVERDGLAGHLTRSSGKLRFLAVRTLLDDDAAARLEDAGIGYVDPAGRWWVPGGDLTPRSQPLRSSVKRALRSASLRLAQLLADHPEEPWTERHLAGSGNATQATAHHLLVRLEEKEFVERRGQGRGSFRLVRDIEGLRGWLAREGRPGRGRSLSCFVPDAESLPSTVGGHQMALSGAAAAERIGLPVRTGVARPLVRVDTAVDELEAIPEALGGFRAKGGANLTLLADPDRLAFTDARPLETGGLIAPPSRIMLDLYLESRGEAAVNVFLSLWGGRTTRR